MSDTPIGRKWTTLSRDMHFSNDHLAVMTERIRTPAREEPSTWTIVQRKSAVVIAAMTAEGKLLLVRQERIPIRDTIWEMPAGQVDEVCDVGSFKNIALRELREETGYDLAPDGEIMFLGDFFCSPGFTDEREFLFLARPVQRHPDGPAHGEQESILDCQEFSAKELTKMIADGDIRDANTLATFARLVARGLISPS